METILSYKAPALLEGTQSGLWVVAVTECVLLLVTALLNEVYDEYILWWLPPDITRFSPKLLMAIS